MLRANEIPTKYATREKNPTNADNMIYYSEDYPAEYVITADDEHVISFPDIPVGAEIVYVELETKPLRASQYSWNGVSRVLTIASPAPSTADPRWVQTYAGQLVKLIYKIKKTTL